MRYSLALLLLAAPVYAQYAPVSPVGGPQQPAVSVAPPALQAVATPLLDDRLTMKLPVGMQLATRPVAIQGADPAGRNEARAELAIGQTRFAVMVEELYASAPADLVATVATMAKGEKPEPIVVPSGLKIVGFQPQHGPPPGETNLIYAAWVVHPDGHVLQLGFLLSSAAMPSRAQWVALAQQVLQTIAAGPRKLELAGGEHTFPGIGTDRLVLNLKPGWTTSTSPGPDFTVYHLRKVGPLATPQPTCGIYVGGHPNPFRQRVNGQGTTAPGVLLGQRADWFSFVGPKGEHTTEAIVAHPLQTSLWVHVFCTAPSEDELKPARASVDTLRVVR